jgi:para-nitrobenzyl esterase
VLVYFYGGGFVAGDGSEARYDGASMAAKGIVSLTVNYRLGIFGHMVHPELTKESPHHASGNYGMLDQVAALKWVQENIAAFGGDPKRVTIAGESAGSISVSALMASPLSKNLFAQAIGESGSMLGSLASTPLGKAEQVGLDFGKEVNATSLEALRAIPADKLLDLSMEGNPFCFQIITIDGYFFPKHPLEIFEKGEQAQVPLLAGWNSEEMTYRVLLGDQSLTIDNYTKAVQRAYPDQASELLKVYKPGSDADVEQVATDLAGDKFIGFSTWKLIDAQTKTGKPAYRYLYSRPRPPMTAAFGNAEAGLAGGIIKDSTKTTPVKQPAAKRAVHSAEIEYALGNLATNKVYDWTPDDYKVSKLMQEYFANFIKTGNPNGPGLPKWPTVTEGEKVQYINIDVNTTLEVEKNRDRYIYLDKVTKR